MDMKYLIIQGFLSLKTPTLSQLFNMLMDDKLRWLSTSCEEILNPSQVTNKHGIIT